MIGPDDGGSLDVGASVDPKADGAAVFSGGLKRPVPGFQMRSAPGSSSTTPRSTSGREEGLFVTVGGNVPPKGNGAGDTGSSTVAGLSVRTNLLEDELVVGAFVVRGGGVLPTSGAVITVGVIDTLVSLDTGATLGGRIPPKGSVEGVAVPFSGSGPGDVPVGATVVPSSRGVLVLLITGETVGGVGVSVVSMTPTTGVAVGAVVAGL